MKNQLRAVGIFWLLAAMLLPVVVRAQDATPAGDPRIGGDLEAAVAWVTSQQGEDGSFAGFSGEADAGTTVDAVTALVAAQAGGVDTSAAVDAAIGYLSSEGVAQAYIDTGVGQAAKLVLALYAAGEDPADFAGTNPLDVVVNGQDSTSGLYGTGIYDHAYSLMALAVTGSDVPDTAIQALETTQVDLGGWAFDASTDPTAADSNTTAMVIQALVATGNSDHTMIQGAQEFLLTTLDDEGGAAYSPGAEADANSTALVAQANIALGREENRALASLQMFQLPSGAFFYQYADTTENLFSTLQAIPAVAGVALPVQPAGAAPVASPVATPITMRDAIAA